MSFGISFTLGMPSDSTKQLLKRADTALYDAKRDQSKSWVIAAAQGSSASSTGKLH